MKVCLQPQAWMGRGIQRVAHALALHKPEDVEIVAQREQAELEVLHVVGCGSLPPANASKIPYAVVQYCFRTTEQPDVDFWLPIWRSARVVWSYYDLPGDGYRRLYQPLGVDPEIFHERNNATGREYAISTHGYVAETEAVLECHRAAKKAEHRAAHLGPNLGQGGDTFHNLSEEDVAALWSRSERVAALRRVEGFELPGVEGLLCGARPIAFDAPHYRAWYGSHAEYVPEVHPEDLITILAEVFSRPPHALPSWERQAVAKRFSWPELARTFWEAVL